jgi:hypothetical protein
MTATFRTNEPIVLKAKVDLIVFDISATARTVEH